MAYCDLLLPLVTYPDVTPNTALANAARLASRLGGAVTVLALQVELPEFHNAVVNAVTGLKRMAREQEAVSARQARDHVQAFVTTAAKLGVTASGFVERATVYNGAERIREHVRTRDLMLLPVGPVVLGDVAMAEAVLFGAGRPIVVFPEADCVKGGEGLGRVAVAWDGSRTAARAVADAMPILTRAGDVRILAVTDEKPSVRAGGATELVRHLRTHGIRAVVDEVPANGERIGRVMTRYVADTGVEVLVMGGHGHSRAREFVLGGATATMLEAPPCPVLLSH